MPDIGTPTVRPLIRVFGGVGVDIDGESLGVGGPRQRRLLALLALRSPDVVSIDWLSEYVWDDADRPDATVSALRTYVSRLRQSLPEHARDWVVTEQGGYRLVAPDGVLEHQRFASLRARARAARESGEPAEAKRLLDEALGLWRGEPFRELEDLDWAQSEIERLRLDRLEMLEERWESALALGRHTQITGELAAFIRGQPLRERAARQYALALYRSGRVAESLRVIDDHRRLLADGTGLEPSAAMVELEDAILTADPSLDEAADTAPLRGYRLLEQIGAGAFSVVWRAIQPSVDRPVAIKQIRSELATQPEFIRRFEEEAQLVARIEHPHVVPLIDFWRDPDAAYLVLRWLPGGTLEEELDGGPLPIERVVRIVEQVGSALAAAHAQSVVHRDVKSANVMFDDAGNAFLTDFGIALDVAAASGPEAALSDGSPAYAAPEQLRRDPLGPAADIFSLAVVAFECLTGRTPFADSASGTELLDRQLHEVPPLVTELRPEVSAPMAAALARGMSKAPGERFARVEDFVSAFASPHRPATPTVAEPVGDNPYVGLRAFDAADADRFFGRRRLVSELTQRLDSDGEEARALLVIGPSGSGKSSVVRAGLLPALRRGVVSGSSSWFVTAMVPGTDPFESLEAALLRVAVNPPTTLVEQLRDGPRGVLRGVRRSLAGDGDVLLLVVDQFEELFVGSSSVVADRFLDGLGVAVEDPSSPLRLVATLRADYYHRPLSHQGFAPILKRSAVDVTPLAPDELEEAITEPARRAGAEFESGLAARVAAEAIGRASPLPLLQHLLADLFERRDGRVMTIAAYEELGGVAGALAGRAEAIHAGSGEAERAAMRHLFGVLADPGEARTDIRRRMRISQLGADPAMKWVLDRFGEVRLLSFDRDSATREPIVEVAHEAVFREWPRLARWLEEDRDVLRFLDGLSSAARAWSDGGREPSDLLRGGRLEQAADLARSDPDRLREVDREFVDESQRHADRERATERRRVRRLRRLNVGVSGALVVALIAGGIAVDRRNHAESATIAAQAATAAAEAAEAQAVDARQGADAARADAEVTALVSRSEALVREEPELAVLLALEAHRRVPDARTQGAVLNALSSAPARITSIDLPGAGPVTCAAFDDPLSISADGSTGYIAVEGRLVSVDLVDGNVTDHGPAPAGCVLWAGDPATDTAWAVDLTVRSGVTLSTHYSGHLGDRLTEVDLAFRDELERSNLFRADTFLPGGVRGDRVLVGAGLGDMVLVDQSTGDALTLVPRAWNSPHRPWAIGGDGRYVVVAQRVEGGESDRLVVLDAESGAELHRVDLQGISAASIAIAGDRAVVGGEFGTVTTVDLVTGAVVGPSVQTISRQAIRAIGIRPDGKIVTVTQARVELVDGRTGPVGTPVDIEVGQAVVRPDGRVTVVAPDRSTASTVELDSTLAATTVFSMEGGGSPIAIADGRAAMVGADGGIELVDLSTGERRSVSDGGIEPVAALPTAEGAIVFGGDARVALVVGDEVVAEVRLQPGIGEVSFAPGGVSASGYAPGPMHATGGAVVVYQPGNYFPLVFALDWSHGRIESELVDIGFLSISATLTPAGGVYVLDNRGRLRTYDADARYVDEMSTSVRRPLLLDTDADGRLALGGIGRVVIADPATGDVSVAWAGDPIGVAFVDGGDGLVVAEGDGSVVLIDTRTLEPLGRLWNAVEAPPVSKPWFDEEAGSVWVASVGRVAEFSLDPERWVELACAFVGREMTAAEWERHVPGDTPQRSACP